jgi:hypothetical protein
VTELRQAGVEVVDFVVRRPSPDDVFLELIGGRNELETAAR